MYLAKFHFKFTYINIYRRMVRNTVSLLWQELKANRSIHHVSFGLLPDPDNQGFCVVIDFMSVY